MPHPPCHGSFQGDARAQPTGGCRKCQPFRSCRCQTILAAKDAIKEQIKAGGAACYGEYALSEGKFQRHICKECPVSGCCLQRGEEILEAADLAKEVEAYNEREAAMKSNIQQALKAQWGDDDLGE
jgi:hypothetical protein